MINSASQADLSPDTAPAGCHLVGKIGCCKFMQLCRFYTSVHAIYQHHLYIPTGFANACALASFFGSTGHGAAEQYGNFWINTLHMCTCYQCLVIWLIWWVANLRCPRQQAIHLTKRVDSLLLCTYPTLHKHVSSFPQSVQEQKVKTCQKKQLKQLCLPKMLLAPLKTF